MFQAAMMVTENGGKGIMKILGTKDRPILDMVTESLLHLVIMVVALLLTFVQLNMTLNSVENMEQLAKEDPEAYAKIVESKEIIEQDVTGQKQEGEQEQPGLLITLEQQILSKAMESESNGGYLCGLLFLLLAVMQGIAAMQANKAADKLGRLRAILYGGIYLLLTTMYLIFGMTTLTCAIGGCVGVAMLCIGRVVAMIKNRKRRSIVLNILCIAVILGVLAAMITVPGYVFLALMAFIAVRELLLIMRISFSKIRLDVLRKVIRKSYAAEILMGMVLLMVATSVVLHMWEPGMENVLDGLWYCFAIVTTIGFGDFTATTVVGRLLSIVLGLYGIVVVALITSIIVNFYTEVKGDKDDEDEEDEAQDKGEAGDKV